MAVNRIQFTRIELQIAVYFFKHYKDRYNARQLARLLHINHAHATKLCTMLAEKHLLTKEPLGNATYLSYAYKNEAALQFMKYLLSLETKRAPKWLLVVLHALEKFIPYTQLGLVFGSSIKTKDFRDVDVLLMYNKKNAERVARIKEEITKSQLVSQPIRYIDLTEKDVLKNQNDVVFYNIISDSLIFHNSEKYVDVVKTCRE